MCGKTTGKFEWGREILSIQYNYSYFKRNESGVWSVIGGDENSSFAHFIPSTLPLNVSEDVCSRYITFPLPASDFHHCKKRHYVRFPLFRMISIKIEWQCHSNSRPKHFQKKISIQASNLGSP